MIRSILLPALRARFSRRELRAGMPPEPIAVFPAAHSAVGDVSIWDNDDEATVSVGEIAHQHFNPHDSSLSAPERAEWITEEVVNFLERLFADRVLFLKSRQSNWSSTQRLEDGDPVPEIRSDVDAFLWSGPVSSK